MLTPAQIQDAALRLDAAEQSRVQIRQLSLQYPEITVDDAYAVQAAWVAHKLSRGRSVYGHKIGLTSRAMQLSSNISEPDYGVLLDDMVFQSGHRVADDALYPAEGGSRTGLLAGARSERPELHRL